MKNVWVLAAVISNCIVSCSAMHERWMVEALTMHCKMARLEVNFHLKEFLAGVLGFFTC